MRQVVYIRSPEEQIPALETAVDVDIDDDGTITHVYEVKEISFVHPDSPIGSCPVRYA